MLIIRIIDTEVYGRIEQDDRNVLQLVHLLIGYFNEHIQIQVTNYSTNQFVANETMGKKQKPRQSRKQPDIAFDKDALKTHLTGFSARKTARRVFGLAKQKQKDRIARNQRRTDTQEALKEDEASVNTPLPTREEDQPIDDKIVYTDVSTQKQWGGEVIVTTTTQIPDDDAEMDALYAQQKREIKEDKDQEYAGSIEKFIHQVRAKLPAKPKRKSKHGKPRGGKKQGGGKKKR